MKFLYPHAQNRRLRVTQSHARENQGQSSGRERERGGGGGRNMGQSLYCASVGGTDKVGWAGLGQATGNKFSEVQT